jgi:hypothetical protein
MLDLDIQRGVLRDSESGVIYADRPYRYFAGGKRTDGRVLSDAVLSNLRIEHASRKRVVVTGLLANLQIEVQRTCMVTDPAITETLSIKYVGNDCVSLDRLEFGFCARLDDRARWHLCAVPFKVQLDGSRHDYSAQDLIDGKFHNAVMIDETRKYMPPLTEEGSVRSEAWAWHEGERGLLVLKYSNDRIELSVASPFREGDETLLKFGGVGFSLFGEPTGARSLEPGQSFTFGETHYLRYEAPITPFELYRHFLGTRGHGMSPDYDPPVNWNELYDIGWHHSKPEELKRFYTREALLNEAAKARDVGCDLLYLDPGWEICEGTTRWDEARLGTVSSLVETLKKDYGLDLGYRTVLRTYQDHWPHEWMIQHKPEPYEPVPFGEQKFWEPCLCNEKFWNEKLKRILEISKQGVRFMMVDEFDWRGPCHDRSHGHKVPTTPLDHTLAVYRLCEAIRAACPGLTIECHDPVWPWSTSIYVPTYFKQGFGKHGAYEENWGFEYMWDCLNDLKTGRALALYYYNLACNIPLYLHITMAADNDACVFFWWCASTVRHLGIGGKTSNKTIEPAGGLPPYDHEKRFAAYQSQMKLYRGLKPYFVRGTFHGISETAHLHTLADRKGGVLNCFNLTDQEKEFEVVVPMERLQARHKLAVRGASAEWSATSVTLRMTLLPMSPALVRIGDCAKTE